ncbi:hypothetical protein IGJ45_003353 [Enterococcus sp. DIV0574]
MFLKRRKFYWNNFVKFFQSEALKDIRAVGDPLIS